MSLGGEGTGADFSGNGWTRYQKLVLSEIEDSKKQIEKLMDMIHELRSDVKLLQFKAGLWGAAAGALPAIFTYLLQLKH